MGKIRGNGLSIALEAKRFSEKLELTEVETLGESVIGELKGLGSTIDAIVQSWYRIREEEEKKQYDEIAELCRKKGLGDEAIDEYFNALRHEGGPEAYAEDMIDIEADIESWIAQKKEGEKGGKEKE